MASRLRVAANGLVVALVLVAASTVRATTLGSALTFGAISTGGKVSMAKDSAISVGDVGANAISLAADAAVSGDLVASVGGISLGRDAAAEDCVTTGPNVKLASGASCSTVDTTGTAPELTRLSDAKADITTYLGAVASLTPTTVIPAPIKVPNSGDATLDDTVSGGLNVFSVPSVTVGKSGVLTVTGLSGTDTAVVEIAGNVILKPDSVFAPSFAQSQLVVVVMGNVVSLGKDSVLDATVIAPNAKCSFAKDSAARGAFLCGKNISFAKDSALDSLSSSVTLP